MARIRAPHKQQPQRAKDELWWDGLDANTQVVMRGASHIKGWLLRLDHPEGGGRYVARSEDGSVRAEFDNLDEAKDFLWAIVNMERQDD